jgi:hypothetical protein
MPTNRAFQRLNSAPLSGARADAFTDQLNEIPAKVKKDFKIS